MCVFVCSGEGSFAEGLSGWFVVAPPPSVDLERTGYLLHLLSYLTRTLCYALLFAPPPSGHSPPPAVPVEAILDVLTRGLKPPPVGHTTETRVLQDATPVLHTALWNGLCVLIRTCHTHLLPYGVRVQSHLLTAITSKTIHQ